MPRSVRPDPVWSNASAGWLQDAREAGDLPPLDDRSAVDDPILRLRFGLAIIDVPLPDRPCAPLRRATDVTLDEGDEIGIAVAPGRP